ncbi:MAG TPA: PKD domain-containing protein [Lacibacter sp.]|nr:PKD domain-containing protein [Lacibacter sp.]HMO89321.1 PKD domain-containing protein [Lacibacter sp.]HMP85880.1 PKD domain-containing protein [Lacibacter sp.]
MIKIFHAYTALLLSGALLLSSCEKTKYSFGEIKTPADLTLTAVVQGVDASNPFGNGTGRVDITATANNALTYRIDFGDGNSQVVPSGKITYKYNSPGTADYTITVRAVGTGGNLSTISKQVKVFVAFEIPANILSALTGSGSKVWVCDRTEPGHFGVGPADAFSPIWYSANPNERADCVYDDEITFSKDANNNIFMNVDNKGQSFVIGAAAGYYGLSSAEACVPLAPGGNKKLAFMDATSNSTSAVSTRIQFMVPGNGIVNFGTGNNTYEILSVTDTQMHLRNIGSDGNAWYQKLKVKP